MTSIFFRTVSSYGDLISDIDLPYDAADAISAALAAEHEVAVWVPDLIAEDPGKSLPGYQGHSNVAVGSVEKETADAVLIRDPESGDEDWFPKSQTLAYEAGPDAEFYVAGGE